MVQSIMRKNQRLIWSLIIVVVVIAFVFWGVATDPSRGGSGKVGKLYGREVPVQEYKEADRATYLYFWAFVGRDPERGGDEMRAMYQQQVWLRLIQKKLKEWGITVSDDELSRHIWAMPMFLTNGRPDPTKYKQFGDQFLRSRGFSMAEFEKVVAEQLAIQKLHDIVASTTKLLPNESQQLYNLVHEKLDISLVTFDAANYTNQVQIADAELKDYFEKNLKAFQIPERRKVRYVRFAHDAYTNQVTVADWEVKEFYETNTMMFVEAGKVLPFEKAAENARRMLLSEKLNDHLQTQASQLMIEIANLRESEQKPVSEMDLAGLGRKFELTAHDTDFFELGAPLGDIEPGFGFYRAAFALTEQEPFSEPVPGEDGVYILQYLGRKETETPTFEAARDRVVQRLTRERALDMARNKGRETARQVRNVVLAAAAVQPAAGVEEAARRFAEEAQKLGLKVLNPPPFSQVELGPEVPDGFAVLNTVFQMREGEASDFVDTARGGLFVLLKRRIAPSVEDYAKDRQDFEARLLAQKREMVVNEWANRQYQLASPPAISAPRQETPAGQPPAEQS